MKGCDYTIKGSLFVLNSILFFAGVGIVVVGGYIVLTSDLKPYADLLINNEETRAASIAGSVLIGIGLCISIIHLLGCFGIFSENSSILYVFSIILGLLLVTEITAAFLMFVFSGHAKQFVQNTLRKSFWKYNHLNDDFIRTGWENIQIKFGCCGVDNFTDWINTTFYNGTGQMTPESCCEKSCSSGILDKESYNQTFYKEGCLVKLDAILENNVKWIVTMLSLISVLQLSATLLACYLGKKFMKNRNWYSMLRLNRHRKRYRDMSSVLHLHKNII